MIDRPTWSTRLLEGVTIVLSILAAFALDSWWDNRLVSQTLDDGLGAVSEELDRAAEHLAQRISVYNQVEGYLSAALDMLASEPDGSIIEVPDTLMAAVLYAPSIDPPTGALQAFLDSGLLTSVDHHEARQLIASLPSRYEDGADDELAAVEYILTRIRPMLERSLSSDDFTAVLGQMDHYWGRLRPSFPWRTPFSTVRVLKTAEIHNLVASRLQMLRLARGEVANLESTIAMTDSLLAEASR